MASPSGRVLHAARTRARVCLAPSNLEGALPVEPEALAAAVAATGEEPAIPTPQKLQSTTEYLESLSRVSDDGRSLLNAPQRYKVLIYSGQLDVIIGAALTQRFLPGVAWHGQAAYNAAPKAVWRVKPTDVEVAGYARVVGNFTQVVVRGAGHIVPGDQPERALDMISRFVEGRGYKSYVDPAKGFVGYRASK